MFVKYEHFLTLEDFTREFLTQKFPELGSTPEMNKRENRDGSGGGCPGLKEQSASSPSLVWSSVDCS